MYGAGNIDSELGVFIANKTILEYNLNSILSKGDL